MKGNQDDSNRFKHTHKVKNLPLASIGISTAIGDTLNSKNFTNHEDSLYTALNS